MYDEYNAWHKNTNVLDLYFRLYDANGDGFIEFREYMPVGLSKGQIESDSETVKIIGN